MFNFSETVEKVDSVESQSFDMERNSISTDILKESADAFWDSVFNDENVDYNSDSFLRDIYGCSENDFSFDFEIDGELSGSIEKFKENNWEHLTLDEKKICINELSEKIAKKLGLQEKPEIEYFKDDISNCGYYSPDGNVMSINEDILNDVAEVLDTIPHELRHAYQFMRGEMQENYTDILYKVNMDNYITPVYLENGSCLLFMDYYNQFVEAEARAFASLFA